VSEYSDLSFWGDRPGPLSLVDHRIVAEGLQAKRTVGEAILRAQWERQRDAETEACTEHCTCVGRRAARLCFEVLRRTPHRPSALIFHWLSVQSVVLLPIEEKGPYLIAVTTLRPREDGSREWLMQAGCLRSRARCAIEMVAAILRDRIRGVSHRGGVACNSCGPYTHNGFSLSLLMDMARIVCEVARSQPSAECMERLVEVLELLAEGRRPGSGSGWGIAENVLTSAPHFPLAALRRFGEATRRACEDFMEWQWWQELSQLIRCPAGLDLDIWTNKVLPLLWPREPSLRDVTDRSYPACIENQLASAAERCRRTLTS